MKRQPIGVRVEFHHSIAGRCANAALILGALFVAAPVALTAQATSTIERITEEFDEAVENPCNGELVQITGTLETATRRTVDAQGMVHLIFNSVPHLRGEGTSGAYKVVGGQRLHDKFIDGEFFPENINFTDDFHIVSQGNAPNFDAMLVGHFVVDADGTVKVEFRKEGAKCTG